MSARQVHQESLTDRYVRSALVVVPVDRRSDVASALRSSISAALEERIERGDDPIAAERAVLVDLGDPMRVGAQHAGRALALIGPAVYPDYLRLLRLLLSIVVPIVAVVVTITTLVGDGGPWQALLAGLGTAFSVGVQLAFWVTLVFAIIDRRGGTGLSAWDIDDLPEPRSRRIGMGETVAAITGLSLLAAFLVWQPAYVQTLGGPGTPILDPALSAFWIPFLVVVLLASIALEIVKVRTGRWTVGLAALNTVTNAAFAIPAVWLLATGQVLNADLLATITVPGVGTWLDLLPTIIAWIIGVGATADVAEGWWKALTPKADTASGGA